MAVLDVTQSPFLAKGNGGDDTAAIQAAINARKPGDTVMIPAGGIFKVNPLANPNRLYYGNATGLALQSTMTFQVDGTLQAIANTSDHYVILLVDGVNGVTITGKGRIIGDRDGHVAADQNGQWGFGIALGNAQNVAINGGLTVSKCWGDGLTAIGTTGLTIDHVTFDSCYRQNASLIDVNGVSITNCTFQNAGQSNLDMEPDAATQGIINVKVANCNFVNCGTLFPVGAKKVHVGLGSQPGIGIFRNIQIKQCQFDDRMQPIWAHDTAGVTGISPWAAALNAIFYQGLKADWYRFCDYPTSWSKA